MILSRQQDLSKFVHQSDNYKYIFFLIHLNEIKYIEFFIQIKYVLFYYARRFSGRDRSRPCVYDNTRATYWFP